MGQLFYRLLVNGTSLATLIAIFAPLLAPLTALTLTTDAAAASNLAAAALEFAELPDNQLKDDDDDEDDEDDWDNDRDDDEDDEDDDDEDDDDDDDEDDRVNYRESRESTTTTTTVTQVSYTDVTTNYWASNFIYRLASINVVSGYPDGEFLPGEYLTKAHYAAMMTKAFDRSAVRETVRIRNVSQYYWAYSALQEAYAEGFIDLSDDDTFDPETNLTKLEMWVMLARSLGYTEVTSGKSVEELLSIFTDADTIPTEYRVIIAALVERGVIVNYPTVTELNLFERVTRAEACSFIYQAMASVNLVETFYSDYIVDVVGLFEGRETTTVETTTTTETTTESLAGDGDAEGDRRNCNQGIGNGAEGCDPGNSRPHNGSNDEI